MVYKDSDYTVVIAIMHCPNRTILVLKLSLVVEIQALLLCRHCSSALFDFNCQYSSYEGPTKILTTQLCTCSTSFKLLSMLKCVEYLMKSVWYNNLKS